MFQIFHNLHEYSLWYNQLQIASTICRILGKLMRWMVNVAKLNGYLGVKHLGLKCEILLTISCTDGNGGTRGK